MFKELLYKVVECIAIIHDWFLQLNNNYEFALSDKALHFIVIGVIGMLIYVVVDPIFKAIAKQGKIGIISWIYTTTLIIVITFAIEIGQKITHTGHMAFSDIFFGIVGFLALHLVYLIITFIVKLVVKLVKKHTKDKNDEEEQTEELEKVEVM